jgi:hypothetical protein
MKRFFLLYAIAIAMGSPTPQTIESISTQPCPARLVTRADTCPVVPVEVFAEQYVVAPMRIVLKSVRSAEHRAFPLGISEKDVRQSA